MTKEEFIKRAQEKFKDRFTFKELPKDLDQKQQELMLYVKHMDVLVLLQEILSILVQVVVNVTLKNVEVKLSQNYQKLFPIFHLILYQIRLSQIRDLLLEQYILLLIKLITKSILEKQ